MSDYQSEYAPNTVGVMADFDFDEEFSLQGFVLDTEDDLMADLPLVGPQPGEIVQDSLEIEMTKTHFLLDTDEGKRTYRQRRMILLHESLMQVSRQWLTASDKYRLNAPGLDTPSHLAACLRCIQCEMTDSLDLDDGHLSTGQTENEISCRELLNYTQMDLISHRSGPNGNDWDLCSTLMDISTCIDKIHSLINDKSQPPSSSQSPSNPTVREGSEKFVDEDIDGAKLQKFLQSLKVRPSDIPETCSKLGNSFVVSSWKNSRRVEIKRTDAEASHYRVGARCVFCCDQRCSCSSKAGEVCERCRKSVLNADGLCVFMPALISAKSQERTQIAS